jgi:hypothetical protein
MVYKPTKSHLNHPQQRILGHIVSQQGRALDPSVSDSITKLGVPTTLEQIRSLLGLAQVAREYVHNLSTIIAPIQNLARKGIDIKRSWGKSQDRAFATLKDILTKTPVLGLPDVCKPFRVVTDACRTGRGLGAILQQVDEELLARTGKKHWRAVAYWSRTLQPAERRSTVTELECTALHDAILHWSIYLRNGLPFEAIVDHYALVYMVTKMGGVERNQRLAHLCLDLQQFTFKVIHRKGDDHLDADAVSRLLFQDESPYVNTIDDLRTDMAPLGPKEVAHYKARYPEDADKVISIIERHVQEVAEENQEQLEEEVQEIFLLPGMIEKPPTKKKNKANQNQDKQQMMNYDSIPDWQEYSYAQEEVLCNHVYTTSNIDADEEAHLLRQQKKQVIADLVKKGMLERFLGCRRCERNPVRDCELCKHVEVWALSKLHMNWTKENDVETIGIYQSLVAKLEQMSDTDENVEVLSEQRIKEVRRIAQKASDKALRVLAGWTYTPPSFSEILDDEFCRRRTQYNCYPVIKSMPTSLLLAMSSDKTHKAWTYNKADATSLVSSEGDDKAWNAKIAEVNAELVLRANREKVKSNVTVLVESNGSNSSNGCNVDNDTHDLSDIYVNMVRSEVLREDNRQRRSEAKKRAEERRVQELMNDVSKGKEQKEQARIYNLYYKRHQKKQQAAESLSQSLSQEADAENSDDGEREPVTTPKKRGRKPNQKVSFAKNTIGKEWQSHDTVDTMGEAPSSLSNDSNNDDNLYNDSMQCDNPYLNTDDNEAIRITQQYIRQSREDMRNSDSENSSLRRARRSMKTVAKKTQLLRSEHREGRVRELIKDRLDRYDYLVQQHYMNPVTNELMEIVCTYYDKRKDLIMAKSRPIRDGVQVGSIEEEEFEHIPVDGDDGAVSLVNLFLSQAEDVLQAWPQNDEEWLLEQQKDDLYKVAFERLSTDKLCIPMKRDGEKCYYHRRMITKEDGTEILGPILRRIVREKKCQHSKFVVNAR